MDRRSRLSAHLSFHDIPLGDIPSFEGAWGSSYCLCFGRTDEGVCPYSVSLLFIDVDCR